ncbi:MAG: hypothetical protein ACUVXJ_13325, partial [Phycisphaerae bacterium]
GMAMLGQAVPVKSTPDGLETFDERKVCHERRSMPLPAGLARAESGSRSARGFAYSRYNCGLVSVLEVPQVRFEKHTFFIVVAWVFTSVMAGAAERGMLSAKGARSKLGLLYLDGGQPSEHLLSLVDSGNVPIMKIPAGDFARPDSVGLRLKKANPKAIVVVGVGAQSKEMKIDRDPVQVYENWTKEKEGDLRTLAKHKDKVDFLSFMPNMWEPKTVEQVQWYCRYIAHAAPRIAEMGFHPVILQSGVGGLPIEPQILSAMVPALRIAKKLGGAWACHGYTLDYDTNVNRESYYSLRYRRAYEYLKKMHPDVADLPMILMEGGVDKAGDPNKDGWQARGNRDKYMQWLRWFDSQLLEDPQVLGVCLFKIGNVNEWKSFDLEPVAPWLREYLKEKNAQSRHR